MIFKDFIDVYEKDSGISKDDMKNIMNECFPLIKNSVIRKDVGVKYETISYSDTIDHIKKINTKDINTLTNIYRNSFESTWSVDIIIDILNKLKNLPNGDCYAKILNTLYISTENKSIMTLDLPLSKAMRYKYKDDSLILLGFRFYFFLKNEVLA